MKKYYVKTNELCGSFATFSQENQDRCDTYMSRILSRALKECQDHARGYEEQIKIAEQKQR